LPFSSFSLPMPRPHPSPTLFPYTTLFRSLAQKPFPFTIRTEHTFPRDVPLYQPLAVEPPFHSRIGDRPVSLLIRVYRLTGRSPIDRKSTRLNSSHVAISYAVFCLKKKKKI